MPNPQEGARRVQRAKAAGRGAHVPREIPVGFYAALTIVAVLGIAAIGYSRYEVNHPVSATSSQSPPRVGQTWYTALGIEVCGHFEPVLAKGSGAASGMTALGNGVVKVAPKTPAETGASATLVHFLDAAGVRVSTSSVVLPGHASIDVANLCGQRPVEVRTATWASLLATRPTIHAGTAGVRMLSGEVVTVAVVTKGATIAQPPTAANLANV